MTTPFEPMAEIQAAFAKVFQRRNWLLGWPTLIGFAVIISIMVVLVGPDLLREMASGNPSAMSNQAYLDVGKLIRAAALFFLVSLIVFPLITGWVLAAAAPVWAGKDPSYGAAFGQVLAKWLPLTVFQLALAALAVVSAITIIGPILVAVLGIYGPAYIIFNDESPFGAIGASFRLAWKNFGATLLLLLAVIVVSIVFAIPAWVLHAIPAIGWVAFIACRAVAQILGSAFVALAVVRFYDRLRMAPGTAS